MHLGEFVAVADCQPAFLVERCARLLEPSQRL
jgi:hypothetical protein